MHFWIGFEVFENCYSETRERTEWKLGGKEQIESYINYQSHGVSIIIIKLEN